jgi:DNA (cytosine-5)-methyltransferase 1
LTKTISLGGRSFETEISDASDGGIDGHAAWWQSFLRNKGKPGATSGQVVNIVDAFCGSGGLALGVKTAIESVGRRANFAAVIDTDAVALDIHRANLGSRRCISSSVATLVDFNVIGLGEDAQFAYAPEVVDDVLGAVTDVDMFIAGPPCQGHSNLNNHTRRADARNDLYVAAAALGVALGAESIIIENVPTVLNSHSNVVSTAVGLLRSSGYGVSMAVLKADELGCAQRRNRHFLLAVRDRELEADYLSVSVASVSSKPLPVSWAIGDLLDAESDLLIDTSPTLTAVNNDRIDYLFDNELHDLPDAQRPDCHKNGTTYTAVYGRLHWDRSAPTITTGFGTPGQGRYVHPLKRRLITPHEAARLQGFPDWFDFMPPGVGVKRKHLNKWIGDAVHPILGYTMALCSLSAVLEAESTKEAAA